MGLMLQCLDIVSNFSTGNGGIFTHTYTYKYVYIYTVEWKKDVFRFLITEKERWDVNRTIRNLSSVDVMQV